MTTAIADSPAMTNAQMTAFVRKRGHVAVPVLTSNDVEHVIVDKTDLLAKLAELPAEDLCPWEFVGLRADGVRMLDAAA